MCEPVDKDTEIKELPPERKPVKIAPTIGRNLYYWIGENDVGILQILDANQPCHATIIFVHNIGTVNLNVIDHAGQHHFRADVLIVRQGFAPPDNNGYAEWMPYQIGQAQRSA